MIDHIELPEPTRRTVFVGTNDNVDWIRGRGFFEEQARLFPQITLVGREFGPGVDRCQLAVILQPSDPGIIAQIEHSATQLCRCRVIVDVYVDFWTPNPEISPEYLAWWTAENRLRNLEAAIRLADITVVSRPELVEVLARARLTDRVAVVPDCPDGHETEAAIVAWTEALLLASARSRKPQESETTK